MAKKKYVKLFLFFFVAVLAMIVLSSINKGPKTDIETYVQTNQKELDQFVDKIFQDQITNAEFDNIQAVYYPNAGMVEFITSTKGIGASTIYEGFYYSRNGCPIGFQGTELDFKHDGAEWRWQESNGDNCERTKKIINNWYWFRMEF